MHILRGELVLPGSAQSKVAVKPSLDAASVKGAAKGKKHWTTAILQFLTLGVTAGEPWGQTAVKHALADAQSYHRIARVRTWQGHDDRENVRPEARRVWVGIGGWWLGLAAIIISNHHES
jgi:hypothetical protein